jgi:hypothetical protein
MEKGFIEIPLPQLYAMQRFMLVGTHLNPLQIEQKVDQQVAKNLELIEKAYQDACNPSI